MLGPAHASPGEPAVDFSSQAHVQQYHAGSLKWAMVGVFTPQRLANAIKQGFPHSLESRLLNIYQHTTESMAQAHYRFPGKAQGATGTAIQKSLRG